MAAAPGRALAADMRWGYAAAAAAVPALAPPAGVVETASKPTNLATQRGALPWGGRPMPPAPNAWGSSSLLPLKKGEGSGSFVNINDRPSSPGSSSTSTDESDLLDSPFACDRTSHDSVAAINHPQSTELRSGSWKFPHSRISFSDVLKAPSRTVTKMRPTSHRTGFTICADDFPVLDSKNSQSNGQQGHSFQGRPSFSSVVIAARDEQRKIPRTGGNPVSTTNISREPKQAQLHATQTTDICMPPPCIDYWHPPDHPPDGNGICHGGAASHGPFKPADIPCSFPVELFDHNGQSLLNQEGEERHGPQGGYSPESYDSWRAHVPTNTFVESLPHLILEKVVKDSHSAALEKQPVIKDDVALLEKVKCLPHLILGKVKVNHSDALEKQPVIKKDLALLEKIKSLNIKARNLHAHNKPEISSFSDSKVEYPKSFDVEADHVVNDVPFIAATSYITSAFGMANSVSESSNHVSISTSNISAILVTTDQSGHFTEFSEARKLGKSADNHVFGVGNTSRNNHGCSETDTASDIWEDQSGHFTEFSEARKLGKSADNHVFGVGNTSRNNHGCSETDTASDIWEHGWKEHSNDDSLSVTTTNNHEDQPIAGNSSQQVYARTANDMLTLPDYEIQLSRRVLSAQHPKPNAKLEELNKCSFVQTQMPNDVPPETKKNPCEQSVGGTGISSHDTSTSDTCTVHAENLNVPLRPNATKNTAAPINCTLNVIPAAKETDINMLEHSAQKSTAESHDSSASKHLQLEAGKGQVHKWESMSMGSTPASDIAYANKSPLIHNIISSTNTEINMMKTIGQKGVSQSNESAPMHLQMEDKRRQVHSQGRTLRDLSPASGSAGVKKGSLIHNVIASAKNNDINMTEHIARKSASQSHENSAPKYLQMENRRRQVRPQERVLRERSNIAESTDDISTVSATHVNARNLEAKPHVDLSTQSKKSRPAATCVFGTENTETPGLHKAPVSGVVINSSIISTQAALARGFTVGSIILGDASVASVNQEKTVAKEMSGDTTNSCASPKQMKQSGKNQHGEQHAKDPQGNDNIMCTEDKEPSKKELPEAGVMNCIAIPAHIQPSGNQSIVLQKAAPAKTSEMEMHDHKPEYKELHLQNLRQMLQEEKHTTSSYNSSSKLKTQRNDKEALDTSNATKSETETELENWEDEKICKHLGRSNAASDQGSTNGSSSLAPDLTEQEANSLVLKIMQELSDQLEQVEKQLDSTHVAAVSRSRPTQMVSAPGYTWVEHRVSHSERQYHVDGQGNVWISHAANVSGMTQGAAALPTAHVMPGPISVRENNMLSSSSAPVWTWDVAESVLTSDMGNVPVVGTAITDRSGSELTENIYRVGQMDLHGMQVIGLGGMAYEDVSANPGMQYHAGLAHQQVNPTWFLHGQDDVRYHSSSGTGEYWPQMDIGAAMQTYEGTRQVVSTEHPGYQLMPVASPGAAYSGMVSTEHLAARTWGAAYGEHMYYA